MSTIDWTAVTAVVTGIGVTGGLVFNGISLRQAKGQSTAAARRAEAAAALASDNSAALVAAIHGLSLGDRAPVEEHAAWSLSPHTGSLYRLENIGAVAAHGVAVEADPTLIVRSFEGDLSRVSPREAITFMGIVTMGTVDTTVTVTWFETDDHSGEQFRWRYPLPSVLRGV